VKNDDYGIRATGEYAKYAGRVYFAYRVRDSIWLHSDDDPLPEGFEPSSMDWIKGERFVPVAEIEELAEVRTTCTWRGHPFEVGIIFGDSANVTYLGKAFDSVVGLPGLSRPDKYEVIGMVPVRELTQVEEHVEEIPLDHRSNETSTDVD